MTARSFATMGFFKNRFLANHSNHNDPAAAALGSLETRVMETVWALGESSVRDVCDKLEIPRAYTTVMTTLERLFKKGLLKRQKSGRAFLYSAAVTREDYERRQAGHLVATFLRGPQPSRELLVSTLLDAVGQHDARLLDELEKKIRLRRKELCKRGAS